MANTAIRVMVNGMTSNGSSTGKIYDWRLYDDNGGGGLGTYLANENTVLTGSTSTALAVLTFDKNNDQNNLFDNLLIPSNSSRAFILTANTNDIFDGKTVGIVSVSPKIAGSTGWNGYNGWNTGNFGYHYTPNGGSETQLITHSDSYEVWGDTLSLSL